MSERTSPRRRSRARVLAVASLIGLSTGMWSPAWADLDGLGGGGDGLDGGELGASGDAALDRDLDLPIEKGLGVAPDDPLGVDESRDPVDPGLVDPAFDTGVPGGGDPDFDPELPDAGD